MGNQLIWPANRHRFDHAADFQDDRCEKGLFRCQRCNLLWPLPYTIQDGFRLCNRCWDVLSPLEAQKSMAEDRARASSEPMKTLDVPVLSAFDGAPCVTAISPLVANITRGSGSVSIAITGVNLSSSDTWGASSGSITVTPTVNSSTSVTLAVSAAGGLARGNYDLTFNGDTLTPRGILSVR